MNVLNFWGNLGLLLSSSILAVGILLLVVLLVASRRRLHEGSSRGSPLKQEPRIYGDRGDDYDDYQEGPHDRSRPAKRDWDDGYRCSPGYWTERDEPEDEVLEGVFGSGGQKRKSFRFTLPQGIVWFFVGLCVGAAGMGLWWNPPRISSLASLIASFESSNPPKITNAPAAPPEPKAQTRLDPSGNIGSSSKIAAGGNPGVPALIGAFVTDLRKKLPLAVGPGVTIETVDGGQNAVAMGFKIAQAIANEDAPKVQRELEARFRNSICATNPEPNNIHGLNERGVSILITYTDLIGTHVAQLNVEPRFCSKR